MAQLPLFQPPSWSVSDLTQHIQEILENDYPLQDLWILGEVSNFSRASSGHIYFTLKDSGAALRCVMWRNAAIRLQFQPRDGDQVEAHGAVNVYPQTGTYQLYVDTLRPTGEGVLYQEFLRLKARLEAEGLFDPSRKRPIPHWPQRIGIVTSPTGAALRDMLNTIRRRYPLASVVLAPTPVQGVEAPPGIIASIQLLNHSCQPDVILVARGGGSIEDLWAFNDEGVARAICASQAPVISGVGHETDFTIADFAADLRAATPTAAAEQATPDQAELRAALEDLGDRLMSFIRVQMSGPAVQLKSLVYRLDFHSPLRRLYQGQQWLDDACRRMETGLRTHLQFERAKLNSLDGRLVALNPMAVLHRGYAVVTKTSGSLVRQVSDAIPGERLQVRVSDGGFKVQVDKKE